MEKTTEWIKGKQIYDAEQKKRKNQRNANRNRNLINNQRKKMKSADTYRGEMESGCAHFCASIKSIGDVRVFLFVFYARFT